MRSGPGAGVVVLQKRYGHELGEDIEERHLDRGAAAGARPLNQCFVDREYRRQAGGVVADRYAHATVFPGRAVDRDETHLGLDKEVVRLHVGVGTGLAVTRDVAGDELREPLTQIVGPQSRPGGGPDGEVLDEHVGLGQDAQYEVAVVGLLDVDDERLLAPVQPREVGGLAVGGRVVAACEVAAVAFKLDDARPGVREATGGQRCRHGLFERDDQDAV